MAQKLLLGQVFCTSAGSKASGDDERRIPTTLDRSFVPTRLLSAPLSIQTKFLIDGNEICHAAVR